MSLIRKPDIEVFRDSSTVTALRGARALAKEGGGGAARAVSSVWLTMMLVVFIMTGLGAMASARSLLAALVCLPLIGAAVWALFKIWRAPTRDGAVELGTVPVDDGISVPLPEHLRGQARTAAPTGGFHVKYWAKAFVNQATLLLVFGGLGLSVTIRSPGFMTFVTALMVLRGVLLLSIFFRGGVCLTAKEDRLCVRSLIGEKEMYWSDVTDVRVETFKRDEWWIMLSTGARHHIVVAGHHRLGSNKLLIPYKLLGLDTNGTRDLVRRLLLHAEIARSRPVQAAPATTPSFGHRQASPPLEEPRSSFDPDAIIQRYLAEREQLLPSQSPAVRPVAGFGRKRVG
jgi:hypothetical protein